MLEHAWSLEIMQVNSAEAGKKTESQLQNSSYQWQMCYSCLTSTFGLFCLESSLLAHVNRDDSFKNTKLSSKE